MLTVFPDYYDRFHCIADRCRHSCCVGWEIDLDPEKLKEYRALPGPLGDRLRRSISLEGDPHFILDDRERCPFLNQNNLCDLILELGEDSLCGICRDHPRFRNQLPGRVETGLGLCCEEAARLILLKETPARLVLTGEEECEDDLIALRDRILRLLATSHCPTAVLADAMLQLCGAHPPHRSPQSWARWLLELEMLDPQWGRRLEELAQRGPALNLAAFDRHMATRQQEYRNLMSYLIYRHLANAGGSLDLQARAAFAWFGWQLLRWLGAEQLARAGAFTPEDQVELGRLFSSEIEYSDENLYLVLDELC